MSDSEDRYFKQVATTGSLRRASEILNVSASAISRKISLLEANLGIALLERTSNGMELTEAGRVYLEYTRQKSRDFENMQTEIGELKGLARGTVNIATVEGMLEDVVMPMLGDFRQQYPGIRLRVKVAGTHEVRDLVKQREVDIGIAMSNGTPEDDFVVAHRFDDSVIAVAAPSHEISKMKTASVRDLIGRFRYALPDESYGIRSIVDEYLRGIKIEPDFVANSFMALRTFVKTQNVLTFLPYLHAYRELNAGTLVGVTLSDIGERPMFIDIIISRNRRISPPAKAMLEMFKSATVRLELNRPESIARPQSQ